MHAIALALALLAAAPEDQIVELRQGDPAPFDGALLTEQLLFRYVRQEENLKLAEGKVQARDEELGRLILSNSTMKIQLDNAEGSSRRWFVLGVGVGAVATVLVIGLVAYGVKSISGN